MEDAIFTIIGNIICYLAGYYYAKHNIEKKNKAKLFKKLKQNTAKLIT